MERQNKSKKDDRSKMDLTPAFFQRVWTQSESIRAWRAPHVSFSLSLSLPLQPRLPRPIALRGMAAAGRRVRGKTTMAVKLPGCETTSGLVSAKNWMVVSTFDAAPAFSSESMLYMIYQRETQARCGKHYQIFIQLKTKMRKGQVADMMGYPRCPKGGTLGMNADGLPNRLAFCVAHGPPAKSASYCSSSSYCQVCGQGDSPYFPGVCSEGCILAKNKGRIMEPVQEGAIVEGALPGRHTEILSMVKKGCGSGDIIETLGGSAPYYMRFVDKALSLFAPKRDFKPKVFWLHGTSGTDKSRLARAVHLNTYCKPPDSKWFDGYDGQPVVVINDLRKMTFTFSYLLDLLDRYPFQVEVKGSYRQFVSKVIIITSSKRHEDLWGELAGVRNDNLDQLTRRLTEQVEFPLEMNEKRALLFRMRTALKEVTSEIDELFGTWDGTGEVPQP